jgi:hypothetical protein
MTNKCLFEEDKGNKFLRRKDMQIPVGCGQRGMVAICGEKAATL